MPINMRREPLGRRLDDILFDGNINRIEEIEDSDIKLIESIDGYHTYQLTNRARDYIAWRQASGESLQNIIDDIFEGDNQATIIGSLLIIETGRLAKMFGPLTMAAGSMMGGDANAAKTFDLEKPHPSMAKTETGLLKLKAEQDIKINIKKSNINSEMEQLVRTLRTNAQKTVGNKGTCKFYLDDVDISNEVKASERGFVSEKLWRLWNRWRTANADGDVFVVPIHVKIAAKGIKPDNHVKDTKSKISDEARQAVKDATAGHDK